MLFARASAELIRALFPDVIGGFMAVEELDESLPLGLIEQTATGGNGPTTSPAEPARRRRRAVASPPQTSSRPTPLEGTERDQERRPILPRPGGEEASGPAVPDVDAEDGGGEAAEAAPDSAPEPELLTPGQLRRLQMLFRERGFLEREHRLAFARRTIGRPIQSSKELTVGEASILNLALEALALNPEQRAELDRDPGPEAD